MFSGVYWNQPVFLSFHVNLSVHPSMCPSVHVSVCVQNISIYQSACGGINPLPDNKILDRSKLKQSADDNFEFDENRKFSKWVENAVGKGEVARLERPSGVLGFFNCME